MIGHGVSSFSSHSDAAGRTTSAAKPWTQSRMSRWSSERSRLNGTGSSGAGSSMAGVGPLARGGGGGGAPVFFFWGPPPGGGPLGGGKKKSPGGPPGGPGG